MKVALIGQQEFGKAVLDAFLARGDTVACVFCAPDKEGSKPCVLRLAAGEGGIPVHQFANLKGSDATDALRAADVDLGVMAYVLQFVPQSFVAIPRHGMIQYHPSLLPRYRGPSAVHWPIARGDTETGLSVFRPTDGLDEGAILLQKRCPIGPDDTLGHVYFKSLFPMGVDAMLEAADLVVAGRHEEQVQDESAANYEGWFRTHEATIHWAHHVDAIYNIVRAADPTPGAETLLGGKRLQIFGARKHRVGTIGAVKGKPGTIVAVGEATIHVAAHGGILEIVRVRHDGGSKVAPRSLADAGLLDVGTVLGR